MRPGSGTCSVLFDRPVRSLRAHWTCKHASLVPPEVRLRAIMNICQIEMASKGTQHSAQEDQHIPTHRNLSLRVLTKQD